jgi:hypothetical protein
MGRLGRGMALWLWVLRDRQAVIVDWQSNMPWWIADYLELDEVGLASCSLAQA